MLSRWVLTVMKWLLWAEHLYTNELAPICVEQQFCFTPLIITNILVRLCRLIPIQFPAQLPVKLVNSVDVVNSHRFADSFNWHECDQLVFLCYVVAVSAAKLIWFDCIFATLLRASARSTFDSALFPIPMHQHSSVQRTLLYADRD